MHVFRSHALLKINRSATVGKSSETVVWSSKIAVMVCCGFATQNCDYPTHNSGMPAYRLITTRTQQATADNLYE